MSLGNNQYLVSSTVETTWTMICEGELHPHAIPSCSICVLKSKCYCSIQSSSFYIPARLTDCHEKEVQMVHGINLAFLHLFAHDVNISTLTSVTTFGNSPKYNVGSLRIKNYRKSSVVKSRSPFSQNFKRIAKNVKSAAKSYDSLSDYLFSTTQEYTYHFSPSFSFITICILLAYMLLSFLLILYLFLRVRNLAATLLLLRQIKPVTSFQTATSDFSKLLISSSMPTKTQQSAEVTCATDGTLTALVIIVLLLMTILMMLKLLKIVKRFFRKHNTGKLVNGTKSPEVYIPIDIDTPVITEELELYSEEVNVDMKGRWIIPEIKNPPSWLI